MITTVVLNPAVDKIYFVDGFEVGRMFRVNNTVKSVGGKGVNVARVARLLGEDVTTLGFKGGETGDWLEAQVAKLGISTVFTEVGGDTRTNNNIIDRINKTETEVLEIGPEISSEDIDNFFGSLKKVLESTKILICSGGLPQGVPQDIYENIIKTAESYGVRVLLDASGKAFEEGIKAKPYMIKPNLRELSILVGRELNGIEDILVVSRQIVLSGIEVVVTSMGGEGAVLVTKDICLRAQVPKVDIINTIGSGDSLVAGFGVGLQRNCSLEEAFKLGTACSVNNAQYVEIGSVDKSEVEKQKEQIRITKI